MVQMFKFQFLNNTYSNNLTSTPKCRIPFNLSLYDSFDDGDASRYACNFLSWVFFTEKKVFYFNMLYLLLLFYKYKRTDPDKIFISFNTIK